MTAITMTMTAIVDEECYGANTGVAAMSKGWALGDLNRLHGYSLVCTQIIVT